MKIFKFLFFALFLSVPIGMSAQTYYFSSPQGYGSKATGGGSGSVTTVTSKSQLESALKASGKGIVIVKGSVQCDYLSVLITDKTLLGLPGAKLYTNDQTSGKSGILYIKPGSKNVIIRNLIFEGPGAYDSDGRDCLTNEGTNVWVDHCEFRDGMDGNFDNKGDCDDVTVSWCKFTYLKKPKSGGSGGTDDHRFTNLVGSSTSDYPSDGQFSITWQYCWWAEGCVERMVRARNAELHMLNCYWNSSVAKKCIGLQDGDKGTQVYLEGGVFETPSSCKNIDPSYGGSPDITVKSCIGDNLSNNSSTVSKPSYSYTALSSSKVKAAVTNSSCGAGATLNVSTSGTVSASCGSDDSNNDGGTPSIKLSTSAGDGYVKLSWSTSNIDVKSFQIYRDTDSDLSGRVRISTEGSSTTSYTDSDVSNGSTYYYSIKVTDNDGTVTNTVAVSAKPSGSSDDNSGTPSIKLSTSAGDGYVKLSWSTSNIDVNNFQIYRDTDSDLSGRVRISSVSSSTTSYTDSDVSNGSTYYYSIKVTDNDGTVTNTDAVSAKPSGSSSGDDGGSSTGSEVHNFTNSGTSSSFYDIAGNLSTSKGTVSYNGLTLTQCLKIESSTSISFTTSEAGTITLVFNPDFTGKIKVDGSKSSGASSGILTISLSKGSHTLTKSESANLYYMSYAALKSATASGTLSKTNSVQELKLYPNPANDFVTIELNEVLTEGAIVEFYDVSGSLMKSKDVKGEKQTVDISDLPCGSYIVKVSNSKESFTKRIIKQ